MIEVRSRNFGSSSRRYYSSYTSYGCLSAYHLTHYGRRRSRPSSLTLTHHQRPTCRSLAHSGYNRSNLTSNSRSYLRVRRSAGGSYSFLSCLGHIRIGSKRNHRNMPLLKFGRINWNRWNRTGRSMSRCRTRNRNTKSCASGWQS